MVLAAAGDVVSRNRPGLRSSKLYLCVYRSSMGEIEETLHLYGRESEVFGASVVVVVSSA